MKFLILGAGMQGRACAFDMLKNPETEEVVLADLSLKTLDQAKRWLDSGKVRALRLDASEVSRVKRLAKGFDAIVSAVPYFLNLPLAKAAVSAKVHFVDLGGNTDIVLKELALHDRAVHAGICVIPDVGLGPGMINTIAAHGISLMDRADEVYIRDGGLPQTPAPPMNYLLTFSEHGLINEYVEDATALRDGRRVTVPGLSEMEAIDLPAPLGRCEAAHASGGLSTMAWTYEGRVKKMDNKLIRYPGHIAVINAMRAMGFFSQEKTRIGAARISPRELSAALFRKHFERPGEMDLVVIRVTVRGIKDGRKTEVVYDMLDRYDDENKMTAMMRTTGFPASIVAQMLAAGAVKPGAWPVETGIPPEAFFEQARKRGFNISMKFQSLES